MKGSIYEIEVSRQGDALVACVHDLRGETGNWHSPPCETAQQLWWYVDRYLVWELEYFPARHCPERLQFREEFMELARRLEVVQ